MPMGYNYGGYPGPGGYYAPPMPDQLAQLRGAQMPMNNQMMANTQMPQQQMPAPTPTPAPPSNGIIWVQGQEGAKAFMPPPGNTVLLMDSDGSSFYLKSADASGMPQPLRIFDYVERAAAKTPAEAPTVQNVEYVTREAFDALQHDFEALAAELAAIKNTKKKVKENTDAE